MKAFTFRGLLLTGFATHPHMWIHSDLSVFLNVLELKELLRKVAFKNFELRAGWILFFKVEEMSKDFLDAVACRSKTAFSSLLESKTNFSLLFQEGS